MVLGLPFKACCCGCWLATLNEQLPGNHVSWTRLFGSPCTTLNGSNYASKLQVLYTADADGQKSIVTRRRKKRSKSNMQIYECKPCSVSNNDAGISYP